MMHVYYFTFGTGHELEGKCQPIKAETMNIAIDKMIDLHKDKWSMCYSEFDWKRYDNNLKESLLNLIVV